MPFLRAGLKNKPKPEPEEPKGVLPEIEPLPELDDTLAEIEPVADTVETAPENEPIVDTVEPAPEVEPAADTVETAPEIEPVADTEEAAQEIEPVSDTVESAPEIEPVVDTVEAVPEVEPAVDTIETAPEIEPAVDAVEPSPEIEPASDTVEPAPEVEPVSDTVEASSENEPATDTSRLPEEILAAIEESPDTESDSQQNTSPDSGQDALNTTDYSGENLKYDFTSGKRYVDEVSTKTEFDKMLDELANISKDLLSWQVEKFAKQHTSKFQGDFDKAESDAKKYEAFLGGYITNAAMTLYDNGYRDIAIKQLEQAKSILEARKKLEEETEATRTRVAENDDVVDLTDILGLFGD